MGFKARRAKRSKEREAPSDVEFVHSSGATNLDALLGEHTLDAEAEARAPKGYRARSIAKPDPGRDPDEWRKIHPEAAKAEPTSE
jgi:hypothetical protein